MNICKVANDLTEIKKSYVTQRDALVDISIPY